ncbi:hypothetical protein ABZV25_13925, partial [Micrococcus luteus]
MSTLINVMSFDIYALPFGDCTVTAHNLSSGPIDSTRIDVYDRSGLKIAVDVNPDAPDLSPGDEATAATSPSRRSTPWARG